MTVCWKLGLTVMRLTEKPQTVRAERPDDRLLRIENFQLSILNSQSSQLSILHHLINLRAIISTTSTLTALPKALNFCKRDKPL